MGGKARVLDACECGLNARGFVAVDEIFLRSAVSQGHGLADEVFGFVAFCQSNRNLELIYTNCVDCCLSFGNSQCSFGCFSYRHVDSIIVLNDEIN